VIPEWTIFLDMDGVSVDFVKGALTAHNRMDLYGGDVGWIPDTLGLTDAEFWRVINPMGVEFWRGLEPYVWFEALHTRVSALGKTIFLTKPSRGAESAAGKMLWLQDRFGHEFRDYILTPRKQFCAAWPYSILIDDQDQNLDAWPGRKVRFPQMWNQHRRSPDPTRIVDEIVSAVVALQRDAEARIKAHSGA